MAVDLQRSYDEIPYKSYPFPQSHPDRLATVGWLLGMDPTPLARARVLEVGCAAGGNIIPWAATLPDAQFVGIDFSAVQVNEGLADVAALGLRNLQLLALDIMNVDDSLGKFDYIVAHGVYSWVPDAVQDRLLELCARHLSPMGIAYVSYNTLPGWHLRSVVRDAMRYHTQTLTDPATRIAQARSVLNFLAESVVGSEGSAYGKTLSMEAEYLRKQPDFYILHDHLEAVNAPIYFHDFAERAAKHRLAYLGEANFTTMFGTDFTPQVNETLARVAPDVVRREQFMDFLRARTFRETLLVRDDVALTRKISPLRMTGLRIAAQARPVRGTADPQSNAVEEFRTPQGAGLSTGGRAIKAALVELAERWPTAIPFDELAQRAFIRAGSPGAHPDDVHRLASDFLQLYAKGIVELHFAPSPFVLEVGDRPQASPVARLHAQRGLQVTSLRHELGSFNEDTRRLFLLLDGTRTKRDIAAALWKGHSEADALRELDAALDHLARLALMVA